MGTGSPQTWPHMEVCSFGQQIFFTGRTVSTGCWRKKQSLYIYIYITPEGNPDSKVHGANMGPTWVLSAPDGPMLAQWTLLSGNIWGVYISPKYGLPLPLLQCQQYRATLGRAIICSVFISTPTTTCAFINLRLTWNKKTATNYQPRTFEKRTYIHGYQTCCMIAINQIKTTIQHDESITDKQNIRITTMYFMLKFLLPVLGYDYYALI